MPSIERDQTSLMKPLPLVGVCVNRIGKGSRPWHWLRLWCHRFAANAVQLQMLALAYNLANFLRTLALPEAVKHLSLTTLRDRLVKTGAKIVRHGGWITFQMAEVMVSRGLFGAPIGTTATELAQAPTSPLQWRAPFAKAAGDPQTIGASHWPVAALPSGAGAVG